MTINTQTEEEQEQLNNHMRRKDVLERVLFESLIAEPASQEQVKRFLTAAPPEVFVLFDGLIPRSSPAGPRGEALHENRIVQGFTALSMTVQGGLDQVRIGRARFRHRACPLPVVALFAELQKPVGHRRGYSLGGRIRRKPKTT